MRIAIWVKAKEITKLDYATLREVLQLSKMKKLEEISKNLSTLLTWLRTRLSLSLLMKVKINIDTSRMSFNIFDFVSNMFFFDSSYLIAMLLSATKVRKRMHFDMIEIVDSFCQLWHVNCWTSSIRICSFDFAIYSNENLIISSNFVQFRELKFDRIIFFDRDHKSTSFTKRRVIIFVQQVIVKSSLNIVFTRNSHELMLVEDDIIELKFSKLLWCDHIVIERSFESIKQTSKIRWVYNSVSRQLRFVNQLRALREKLELEYYERKILTQKLQARITLISLTCFIDDFDFYKNMYKTLTRIYFTLANITL